MNIQVKNSVKPIDYIQSMNELEKRVHEVLMGKNDELLWILEHNTVYTAGSSSNNYDLLNKNIKVIKTNRGGKHTLHSPGQKVIYFVLNLNKRGRDIRKLITNIEDCIIEVLSEYNLKSYPDKKNIGVWVGEKENKKKIAAIGIKVKKWIAYHGFAINVNNDLSMYKNIIPCGIKDKEITSLKEMGVKDFDKINKVITKSFLNIFP
mgnify:CR=1 FL=1|tara:strand:- start:1596 stop:2213 length:618 start_codon:yes stop_codon:yes gene_type:complete